MQLLTMVELDIHQGLPLLENILVNVQRMSFVKQYMMLPHQSI